MALDQKVIKILNRELMELNLGDFLSGLETDISSLESAVDAVEAGTGPEDDSILAGKLKVVNRDLEVAIESATATATNAEDIDGIPQQAHFIDAAADATATEITSVRFVPSTGALTVTVNANATAATTVRVPIIQAA
jgi:hypothetical protein